MSSNASNSSSMPLDDAAVKKSPGQSSRSSRASVGAGGVGGTDIDDDDDDDETNGFEIDFGSFNDDVVFVEIVLILLMLLLLLLFDALFNCFNCLLRQRRIAFNAVVSVSKIVANNRTIISLMNVLECERFVFVLNIKEKRERDTKTHYVLLVVLFESIPDWNRLASSDCIDLLRQLLFRLQRPIAEK